MTIGVLVMAHGTPRRVEDLDAFYTRIRRGRPPNAEQLADLAQRYRAIGGVSPLNERTDAQVAALEVALTRRGADCVVSYGAKFVSPDVEAGAAALTAAGVERVVGLVLAPHGSSLSTGQYHERAAVACGTTPYRPVPPWGSHEPFLLVVADRVRAALGELAPERRAGAVVIFTAHSLPERILADGENYPDQLTHSARRAAALAGVTNWTTAFQSPGRTEERWLGPDLLTRLGELRDGGVADVVACPIGFVSDHLEILYDLDIEAAQRSRDLGLGWSRTQSLNDDPRFADALAELVLAT